MTDLDQALVEAENDQARAGNFYTAFLNSELFVPAQGNSEQEGIRLIAQGEFFKPLVVEFEGKVLFPVFDLQEKFESWARDSDRPIGCVRVPAPVFIAMVIDNAHVGLNPGTELAKEFTADEIQWLKSMIPTAPNAAPVASTEASARIGNPSNVPPGLMDALRKFCKINGEVSEAYLAEIFRPAPGEKPGLCLVLKLHPEGFQVLDAISQSINLVIRGVLPNGQNILVCVHDGENDTAKSITEAVEPFYR